MNQHFANTGSLAHKTQNDTRLQDFLKEVRELGRENAEGRDSLPKLAVRVVRASNDGIITLERDNEGNDDAKRLYTEFVEAQSKKAVHDHTENGLKANVSKLRQLITFGALTTCDPVDVLNRTMDLRRGMETAKEKIKAPYASYVDVARSQIASDADLSDDAIKSAIRKKEPAERDVLNELTKIEKSLERLITGEKGPKDTSEEVLAAHASIKKRLATMVEARATDEIMEKAATLGLTVVKPGATEEVTSEVTSEPIAA